MCVFIDEELDDKKPLIVSGMKILLNEQSLKVIEGGREGERDLVLSRPTASHLLRQGMTK